MLEQQPVVLVQSLDRVPFVMKIFTALAVFGWRDVRGRVSIADAVPHCPPFPMGLGATRSCSSELQDAHRRSST